MNHLAWFAGVQDVQYCSVDDQVSHFTSSKNANGLPSWQTGCLFEDATVATLERPDNVPYQGALAHFLSDVDSRHAYAVIGTPGGDLGEFARGIGALEQLLGIEIAADQVSLEHAYKRLEIFGLTPQRLPGRAAGDLEIDCCCIFGFRWTNCSLDF